MKCGHNQTNYCLVSCRKSRAKGLETTGNLLMMKSSNSAYGTERQFLMSPSLSSGSRRTAEDSRSSDKTVLVA